MASIKELYGLEYGLVDVKMPPYVADPTLVFENPEPGSPNAVESAKLLAFDFADFVRQRLDTRVGDPRLAIVKGNVNWSIPGGLNGTKHEIVCGLVTGTWEDRKIKVTAPLESLGLYPRSPFYREPFGTNRVAGLLHEYAYLFMELNRVHKRGEGFLYPGKVPPLVYVLS